MSEQDTLDGGSTPIIEAATLAELPRLMDIERLCFSQDLFTEPVYADYIRRADCGVWLHLREGVATGSLVLMHVSEGGYTHVLSVAVHPDFRRQGIGRTLMLFAESQAQHRGCPLLVLEVRQKNHAAQRLYKSLGYETLGVIEDFYGEGKNAIQYYKFAKRS